MMGCIARIQRFSTTNGPGLRSTVFMKGCPLRCLWCHNPEMQSFGTELMVYAKTCTSCGMCQSVCENGGHHVADGEHLVSRENCILCGQCEAVCPHRAIEMVGEDVDSETVVRRLLRDRVFYENGRGGITLSGGEPLAQFEFTKDILTRCKAEGLHTCLDTSGWGGRADELTDVADLFLWDLKETDPERHLKVTGVPLDGILCSLRKVNERKGKVILRCPIIPEINDREEHIVNIGRIANELECIQRIDLIPYHRFGVPKAEAVGMHQESFKAPDAVHMEKMLDLLRTQTSVGAQWM